ncbi:MAG: LamG domain-containing protein [Polyangiaceae bacterium]
MTRDPRPSEIPRVRAAATVGLLVLAGGCSLISLDELQSGASGLGGAASSSGITTASAGSTSMSSGTATGTSSGTSSAGGSTSAASTTSASSSSGGMGDDAYVAAVTADTPIAWWRLSEAAGAVAKEEIAGRDGAYGGALMLGAAPPFASTSDKAVRFLGGQVTVDHPELAIYDAASSIEAWVRADTIDTNHRGIVDIEWPAMMTDKQGYRMYLVTFSGVAKVTYGRTLATMDQDMTIDYPNDGQYHHLVGTYDGGTTICIYIDATMNCQTRPKVTLSNTPMNVVIGARTFGPTTASFRGSIDEVALYDKALSAARVKAHFDAVP